MLKIDTLHITFQLQPRDTDIDLKDLHDLCAIMPTPGLRPFASNVFDHSVFLEQTKPLHGYAYGYAIIDKVYFEETQTFKTVRLGSIFYGGNSNRPFLQFNGEGCKLLNFENLRFVVEDMYKARITRCDLAYDDVDGSFGSIVDVVQCYKDGLFKRGGHQPSVSQAGDWISEKDSKGRTLYVGSRKGSCMMRIYEKGKELGNSTSPWIRYEAELKAVDCVLPFSILTDFDSVFLKLNEFNTRFSDLVKRTKLKKKNKKIDDLEGEELWKHRVKYATMQAGAVLLEHLYKNDGDLGCLVSFAKSSKIKVDRVDKDFKQC